MFVQLCILAVSVFLQQQPLSLLVVPDRGDPRCDTGYVTYMRLYMCLFLSLSIHVCVKVLRFDRFRMTIFVHMCDA